MDSALYTAASGMIARQRDLEVTANNLANASAPGFRPDATFYELWRRMQARHAQTKDDAVNSGVYVPSTYSTDRAGTMETTGAPLDVGIEGNGWVVVRTRAGDRYSRGGSLRLGPDGTLVTTEGFPVLGASGPVKLPPGRVEIDAAGSVRVDGQETAKLKIASPAPKDLVKEGGNAYRLREGAPAPSAGPEVIVRQGSIETSSVEPIEEMIRLIEAQRLFEQHVKTLNLIMNEINRRSVNDLVGP